MLVTEQARQAAPLDQRIRQALRKGRDRVREIAPFEGDRRAGDLPMARLGILAFRPLDAVAPLPRCLLDIKRLCAGRRLRRLSQSQSGHMGDVERASELADDMAERIGARIAEAVGVRRSTDAEGIEDEEECPAHIVSAPIRSRTGTVFIICASPMT